MHHFFQAFAFVSKFVHSGVFLLKGPLEIIYHSLFNFFELFNSVLVSLTDPFMFGCLRRVSLSYTAVVGFSVVVFVICSILTSVQ